MQNNLQLYHRILRQLCQWLPDERITRKRNMALLVTGLYLSAAVHLSLIVRKWPTPGKIPSLVNRLRRFLDNPRVSVRDWYRPVAAQLVQAYAGQCIRLVIDCTKVGFRHRMLTISIAYRRRTCPWRGASIGVAKGISRCSITWRCSNTYADCCRRTARSGWWETLVSSLSRSCAGWRVNIGISSSDNKAVSRSIVRDMAGLGSATLFCLRVRPSLLAGFA